MQGRRCLRLFLLTTVFLNLMQGALQMSVPEVGPTSSQVKEVSGQQDKMNPPVKRFVGSIAREGGLPPSFHGKRRPNENEIDHDENIEEMKRYLGSVVRQGFGRKRLDDDLDEEIMLDDAIEKRHLGSMLRFGDSRFGGGVSSSLPDKRFLGSLARVGELGRISGKKRHLGSLARVNGMPFRAKRTTEETFWDSDDLTDENQLDDDWAENDDLLIPLKRNIASLARNGWLPQTRSQRRQEQESAIPRYYEEAPKRNYYYRPPPSSLSGRSHLLSWLRREEARLKDEAETRNGQGKRTIAALARGGELPIRYRFSRSADLLPSPPFMRMASYRGGGGGGTSIRAPHAFVSFHEGSWERPKRNADLSQEIEDEPCTPWNPDGCGTHKGEAKRYFSSLLRGSKGVREGNAEVTQM